MSPKSNGGVYSGAWSYPEGAACCGRSLDACPMFMAQYWARYAVECDSPWARELARRQTILAFYHSVVYGKGRIEYATFDAPASTVWGGRLCPPRRAGPPPDAITADGRPLAPRADLKANGYTVAKLPCGDAIISVRHDGARSIVVGVERASLPAAEGGPTAAERR